MRKLTERRLASCSDDPTLLLEHIGSSGWSTTRKFRLFCCSAVRCVAHLIDLNGMKLIQVAEKAAEEACDPVELASAIAEVEIYLDERVSRDLDPQKWNAGLALLLALDPKRMFNEWQSALYISSLETWPTNDPSSLVELTARVGMIRCIFEDPYRPASQRINPQDLSRIVIDLARSINSDQAFDRLPILADAFEECGCGDWAVLNHCRKGGKHVRGCWVLDLVLGHGVTLPSSPRARRPELPSVEEEDNWKEVRLRFERISATGWNCTFRFLRGQVFEGGISDVSENAICLSWSWSTPYAQGAGATRMSPLIEWVQFAEIDPESIKYWDNTSRCWLEFPKD